MIAMLIGDARSLNAELSMDTVAITRQLEQLLCLIDRCWVWILGIMDTFCFG